MVANRRRGIVRGVLIGVSVGIVMALLSVVALNAYLPEIIDIVIEDINEQAK